MRTPRDPRYHPADQHFESLIDYLWHLVVWHGIEETPELWKSDREQFDALHAAAHSKTEK